MRNFKEFKKALAVILAITLSVPMFNFGTVEAAGRATDTNVSNFPIYNDTDGNLGTAIMDLTTYNNFARSDGYSLAEVVGKNVSDISFENHNEVYGTYQIDKKTYDNLSIPTSVPDTSRLSFLTLHSYNSDDSDTISDSTFWRLSGETNGESIKLKSVMYQGVKLNANCELPDYVDIITAYKQNVKVPDPTDPEKTVDEYYVNFQKQRPLWVLGLGTAFNKENCLDGTSATELKLTVPLRITTLDVGAFKNNTKMKEIMFKGNINQMGNETFYGCTNLEKMNLNLDKIANNSIPDRCFYKCQLLQDISIPESIQNIGTESFYQCNVLDRLTLHESIKTIGKNAFAMCKNLRWLYIKSSYSNWDSVVDASEKAKLITKRVTEKPLVAQKGGTTEIANIIFSPQDIEITSRLDIEPSTLSVTCDGNRVETQQYYSNIYGYNTIAFRFRTNVKGLYEISATDLDGNKVEKQIKYTQDVDDRTKPVVTLTGDGDNDIYKSVKIEFTDNETYIMDAKLNDEPITSGQTISEEGEYILVVSDAFKNTETKRFKVDKTAPVITNKNDSSYNKNEGNLYNKVVTLTFEDNMGIKDVIIDKKSQGPISTITFLETKKHDVKVIDFAGNSASYSLTVDLEEPILKGVVDNKYYNKSITINSYALSGVKSITYTYKAYNGQNESGSLREEQVLSKNGEYTVRVTNMLDKYRQYRFFIDKSAPKVTGVKDGGFYRTKKEIKNSYGGTNTQITPVRYTITDDNLDTITLNGSTSSSSSSLQDDGKYTLIATDKAGNKTVIQFRIDNKCPKISGVKNGKTYGKAVTIKVSDTGNIQSIKLNKKKIKSGYKVQKNGKYTVVATDKSGNSTTIKFTIKDKTKPKANVKNGKTYKRNTKIKVSDSGLGIKSIKLNKKTIKNNYKLKKKGNYTLVVTDKGNNKLTVKFKVK